jgi:hypothetical protein
MEHPIPIDQISPQILKFCGPDTPPQLKAMAAEGIAPLGPADLVTALYILAYDTDATLAEKATNSIQEKVPKNVLMGAIGQINNGTVLDGLAHLLINNTEALQQIMLNQSGDIETAIWIAGKSKNDKTLEIIASNETRLLQFPKIIETLYNNRSTRVSTANRIVELAARNNVELPGIACFKEIKAALEDELLTETTDEPLPDDDLFKSHLEFDDDFLLDDESLIEALDSRDAGEEKEETEVTAKIENLEQSLAKMTISSKIRVATLGSSRQRAILIRDSNKLVSMAVIKSPGLSDSEIMQFSKYRSLPEEALRFVASNREWTKHYQIKLNLVQNPRSPIEYSLRFLAYLRANDVRALERDKNIPQAVAKAARQLRAKRMN